MRAPFFGLSSLPFAHFCFRRLEDSSKMACWTQLPPIASKSSPRWLQDVSRSQLGPNLGPTWRNLAASWPQIEGNNEHFVWEWLHFSTFRRYAFEDALHGLKMAPRGDQERPRELQEPPRGPQDAPRWSQGGPKTAPFRLKMAQAASMLPLSCHLASHVAANLLQDASEVGFRPSRCPLGAFLAPSWPAK